MSTRALARLRKICLALPETAEVVAWGTPTFRVRDKLFAMYAEAGNHHGEGREGIWIKAPPGNQPLMVRAAPERFFVPPYVGPSGWIGVYLDGRGAAVDWAEVAELLADGWRMTAPKRLVAATEGGSAKPAPAAAPAKKKAAATPKRAPRKAAAKKPAAKKPAATQKATKKATKKKAAPKRRRGA